MFTEKSIESNFEVKTANKKDINNNNCLSFYILHRIFWWERSNYNCETCTGNNGPNNLIVVLQYVLRTKKQQVWSSDFCVSHKEFSFFVKKIIKRSCLSSFEINHSLTNVEKLRTASVVVFLFIIKTKLIFILQKTFKNLWHSNHFLSFKKIKRRCVEINYIWAPFSFTWSLFGLENILTEGFFHKKWNCFDVQSLTHISTFSIEKST